MGIELNGGRPQGPARSNRRAQRRSRLLRYAAGYLSDA